VKHSERSDQLF